MGFSFKKTISKALPGTFQGALVGGAVGGIPGALIGAGGGGLLSSLFSGGDPTTVSQGPLETPEQAFARRELLKFATSGSYNGFNAGEAYTGSLGDFDPTSIETAGLGKLNDLFSAGRPGIFDKGVSTLNDLLDPNSRFDPYSATGEFNPFNASLDRELKVSGDKLKQNLAYSGNLYSTDAGRQFEDLQAQGNEQKASKLASLFSEYTGRKLNAVPLALQAGQDQQNLDLGLVDASQKYGSLTRLLNNQKAQAAYAEFQRQRGDKASQINALQSVAGTNTPFGVQNVTLPGGAGPFDEILNLLGQYGAYSLASRGGGSTPAVGSGSVPNGYFSSLPYNRLSLNYGR